MIQSGESEGLAGQVKVAGVVAGEGMIHRPGCSGGGYTGGEGLWKQVGTCQEH